MNAIAERYDFFDRQTMAWPFEMYRAMREHEPVCRIDDPGTGRPVYMITPHALCVETFKNSDDYSNRHAAVLFAGGGHNPAAEAELARGWPEMDTFDSDPPAHGRYRTLSNKAFTPAAITRLTDFIRRTVDDLIDGFIERGECDFHQEFAVQLPIYAMIAILGVGPEMRPHFQRWADAYGVMMARTASPEEEVQAARDIVEFQHYVRDLLTARRAAPQDDIVSALIDAREDGPGEDGARFTDSELLSMIRQFMLAGSETTRNALTYGLGLLLRHPDQLAMLRADPALVDRAVDEMLRFQTPVGGIWRIVRRDHELAGVSLREGDIVMIRMDSANHDESVFERPDEFDITRPNLRHHVAFGQGIHFCLGAMLARKELHEAFPRLLERLQDIAIDEERSDLAIQPGILLRVPGGLQLTFRPGLRVRN